MSVRCLACDIDMIGIGSDQKVCVPCASKYPGIVEQARQEVQRELLEEQAAERRQQEINERRAAMRAST